MSARSTQGRKTLIQPLGSSDIERRDWIVEVDGMRIERPSLVTISSPKFGHLSYGLSPGGYDSWSYVEAGSGGVAIVPFFLDGLRLLVGVLLENRHNLGGITPNVPRGQTEAGETSEEAARRELFEETGLVVGSMVELPGGPVNCNSAFFETPSLDVGVRFFATEIASEVTLSSSGEYVLREVDNLETQQAERRRVAEGISGMKFVEWQKATEMRDMFTLAAVARLTAWLRYDGRPFC